MDNSKIYRAAVGQIAHLGEYYDARKDEFLCINAFDGPLEDKDIFETEINSSNGELILTDLVTEQFEKLDINGQLALSILCGLVKLSGSATYLNSHKNSANSAHMTLTYSVRTKYQEVNGICSKVNTDSLNATDATHIVVGIEWGAKCNITCERQTNGNENIIEVRAEMETEMKKLKEALSVKGNTKVNDEKGKVSSASKFSYHTKCDVSDLEKDIPTTFEGALAVAKSFPTAVTKTNKGKGVPQTYTLLSLNSLRKMCNLDIKLDAISKQIEEHIARKCFQTMQAIRKNQQQINDLLRKFNESKDAVPSEDFDAANELLNKFEIEEAKFKSELRRALVEARSGRKNGLPAIEGLLQLYLEGDLSPEKVSSIIKQYECTVQKLRFINELKDSHVLYIGKGGNVELALFHNANRKVYVFYMDYAKRYSKDKKWQQHQELFFRLVSAHSDDKGVKLIAIDCELLPEMTPKKGMCIEFYENGILCCEDLLQEEGQDVENCMIKLTVREPLKPKPNKRVPLEISCPKSFYGSCAKGECQWICKYCKETVEYAIDDQSLYCGCGKSSTFDSVFRCNDTKHGLSFIKFDPNIMKQVLSSLRSFKETNIILLGETGVGKSTWINAIANYFAFTTLKDAIDAKDMKVYIPSQFSYTSETGLMQKISVGSESTNEILKTGQSATQGPKAYKFYVGSHTVSLIDTPGIGDVRGLEQDEENFENILAHLSYYDEIHGICILLKPNDSRLTTTFRFCITELLTHLHKSAAENIVFCFTNARSTFYRPGDTLPMLKTLLSEYKGAVVSISPNNQFCFDNEAFRFLACLKNGVQFNKQDIDTYSSSWDRAVTETNRLFKHIQNLKPHSIKNTVSLNNARKIILELSKPLAETAATIQINIDSADAKSEELEASNKTAKELQDQLYLDGLDLEPVHLDYPRTVCTHSSCVEYVQVSSNAQKTVYKQQCHDHCYLTGVPTETVNNAQLQSCRAMGSGPSYDCRICGHSWKLHMHMTYDLEKKTVRVIDKNKQKLLTREQNHAANLDNFIRSLKVYSQELKDEQAVITNICAQFGCYLKKNAITPFNDDIDSHLRMLIRQENNKPSPSQSAIENWERMRKKYEQQKLIIYKAMEQNDTSDVEFISEPGEVEKLKEKLFGLKHNGASLKKIFEEIKRTRIEYRYNETQVVPVARSNAQGGLWQAFKGKARALVGNYFKR